MKEVYEELYNACSDLDGFIKSSNFVALRGNLDHQNTRFLLIGRAVNGWDDEDLRVDNAEEYSLNANREFYRDDRWNWIVEYKGGLYSSHTNPPTYCVSQKPFWNYSKSVWEGLSDTEVNGKWMENIAWSNLYKVSPPFTGNPEKTYMIAELEACKKILMRELEIIQPTHIFLPVGYYEWFQNFEELFSDVHYLGSNVSRGKNKNSIYVEATAKWKSAKVVVACRPEYRDKDEYVKSVLEAFSSI